MVLTWVEMELKEDHEYISKFLIEPIFCQSYSTNTGKIPVKLHSSCIFWVFGTELITLVTVITCTSSGTDYLAQFEVSVGFP